MIRTDPAAGTEVAPDSTVTMVVSTGPAVETTNVPNVQGLSEDRARTQLENAGFRVVVSEDTVDQQNQDGRVISQSPAAGSQAQVNSEINIVIGRFDPPDTTISIPIPGGD